MGWDRIDTTTPQVRDKVFCKKKKMRPKTFWFRTMWGMRRGDFCYRSVEGEGERRRRVVVCDRTVEGIALLKTKAGCCGCGLSDGARSVRRVRMKLEDAFGRPREEVTQ